MNQIAQHGFNYGQLTPMEAAEVRAASERIKLRMGRLADDIVAIGKDLIATKQRLEHGKFGEWIQAEFGMSYESAAKLMSVARRFGDKSVTVTDLGLTTRVLYQLAAPSTPDEVVSRTIEARRAGESVTTADVKRWKEEAQRAREEAEAIKRAKAEADAKIADANARLEKAREEYRKLQNRQPERVEIEKVVEVEAPVPSPYVSWAQYEEARRNLMDDAEQLMRKAKAEVESAKREVARIKIEKMEAERAREEERNERSRLDNHNVHLTALRNSIAGFLRNNAEHFMGIDHEYLQQADVDYLSRVENHLREMADKIASVRGVSAEYAEFEVVNG